MEERQNKKVAVSSSFMEHDYEHINNTIKVILDPGKYILLTRV